MDFIKKEEKSLETGLKDGVKKMTDVNEIEKTFENGIVNIQDPFDTEHRKPMFNFLGITDFTFLDLSLGFATGVYHRDVKEEWHQCLGGPIVIFRDIMKLFFQFISQDFTNIMGVLTNFVLLQQIVDLIFKMLKEVPSDIKACGGIYTEMSTTVNFLFKHANPATLLTNVGVNLLTHIFDVLSDVWNLAIAMFSFNWFEIGKLTGEMLMIIIE